MKNRHAEIAYNMGYRTTDNSVISPSGKSISTKCDGGYPEFGFRPPVSIAGRRMMIKMATHKLSAFQKFGQRVFDDGIEIRHMDGNRLNFSQSNLELGTPTQNWFDRPESQRENIAKCAALSRRVFSDEEIDVILADRKLNMTYSKIGKKYGITKMQARHFCNYKNKFKLASNVMVA